MRVYTLLILPIMLLAMACGSTDNNTVTITVADTLGAGASADSVATPEPPKPDTTLTHDVASADEAIAYMEQSPYAEKYRTGILPQMAKDNLDYCTRLLKSPYNYFIVVDKPSMYVVLYDRFGNEVKAYRCAVSRNYGAKHKRRDNRTPEGFFSAEGIYDSTDWLYTNDDGYTSPAKGQFGPRYIRLKTDVTNQVGIHGTAAPGSLGRRASHGCIRLHNNSILELVKYATPGMPIIVNPSERDQQVNRQEGFHVPTINIGKPVETPAPDVYKNPYTSAKPDSTATNLPTDQPPTENPAEDTPSTPTPDPVAEPAAEPAE